MKPITKLPGTERPSRFLATVGLLVLVPVVALALLGLWFVEAQKIAFAEGQRKEQQVQADIMADAVGERVNARTSALLDEIFVQFRNGGPQAVRNHYLTRPELALAVIFDASGTRLFPEPQEMPLFAEDHYLKLTRQRLTEAYAAARKDSVAWAGSMSETSSPVAACKVFEALAVCLLVPVPVLMQMAAPAQPVNLVAPGTAPEAMARVLAPLPAPFTGFALAQDYRPAAGYDWPTLMLLFVPTALGTAFAAWLLVLAQRAQMRAETRRIDLLAEISHELRTPLANLRLYSGMLAKPGGDGSRAARYARIIEEETLRLSGIVDNALTVTVKGQPEGQRLRDAVPDDRVRALLDRYGASLAAGTELALDLRASAVVRFDLAAFEHVLLNLLDNARKHAPGARVRISTGIRPTHLVLDISDDGARHPRRTEWISGFGLGLNACRSMAERAGGRFTQSIAVTGSRFRLELPASPCQTPTMMDEIPQAVPCIS
ncbi:MAG: sensor histidine kinase [Paracoccaceae bacterium]